MAESTKYWKGIEELEQNADFTAASEKEFSEYVPADEFLSKSEASASETNRRDFLKVLGFSLTAATLAACEAPVTRSIPFLNKPVDATPGIANYYASTYFDGIDHASVLVKTREGRPIFINGNSASPFSKGVNARINSSVLSLYDSKRAKGPAKKIGNAWAKNLSFSEVDREIAKTIRTTSSAGGKVVLLSNTIMSPSSDAAIAKFSEEVVAKGGQFEHVMYDSLSSSGVLDANEVSFGKRAVPSYFFERAKTIVSFGADFLGNWLDTLVYSGAYAKRRKPDGEWMSRHYHFETSLSITGSVADVRAAIKPSEQGEALKYLFGKLGGNTSGKVRPQVAAKLDKTALELSANKGESLVICGSNDENIQILVNAINDRLGNVGKTFSFSQDLSIRKGSDARFTELCQEMNKGKVDALIVVGLNPSFVAPSGLNFASCLSKVDTVIYTGDRLDETGEAADFLVPTSHFLESWDITNPKNGVYGFTQPTISPLFKTRQWQESLLTWSGDSSSYEDFVKATALGFLGSKDAWNSAVHDGFYVNENQMLDAKSGQEATLFSSEGLSSAVSKISAKASGAYELELYVKMGIGNGDQAFNPWLHEMPDPISKMTYDNYIAMNPADVLKLYAKEDTKENRRDFLYIGQDSPAKAAKLQVGKDEVVLPVVPQPGQALGTVSVAVGYGRKGTEAFTRPAWLGDLFDAEDNSKNTLGKNVFPFAQIGKQFSRSVSQGVEITPLDENDYKYPMATTQTHHTMMGRKLVNETNLQTYIDQKGKAKKPGGYNEQLLIADSYGDQKKPEDLDLWAEHAIDLGHRWGLTIDLNTCTGCGVCVTACHLENNVPVVGKDEVRRSREMHWLRVDRYYSSTVNDKVVTKTSDMDGRKDYMDAEVPDSEDNVSVVYQPIMCQHCNHAPCETVCPVAATTHSDEGLNQMTYNRCVGTRYCANNCPYKVRRFNWFQYDSLDIPAFPDFNKLNPAADDLGRMVLNPDVVVRSRGVMEKCSMCIQTIQEAKLEAKKEGIPVQERHLKSACSDTCPIDCISFGDLNDPNHKVHTEKDDERSYLLMEETGVQPNVYYQTKVRNNS